MLIFSRNLLEKKLRMDPWCANFAKASNVDADVDVINVSVDLL